MLKLEPKTRIVLLAAAGVFLLTVLIVALFGGAWQKQPAEGLLETSPEMPETNSAPTEATPLPLRTEPSAPPAEEGPVLSPAPIEPAPEEPPALLAYVTLTETPVFALPSATGEVLRSLPEGSPIQAEPTQDPLWYVLPGEEPAYLYAECLGDESGQPIFATYFQQKVVQLQEKLPQDKYWNHPDDPSIPWGTETPWHVTDIPCQHWDTGELYCNFYAGAHDALFGGTMDECLGFASLLSDQIYGVNAPLHVFENSGMLRVGDHIRLREYEHSMIVLGLDDSGILVAECNENYEDCRISWTRKMTWDEFHAIDWDAYFISRYPFSTGPYRALIPWED